MDCIFCKIIDGEIPSYKLFEDDKCICILNINPDAPGHSLIIPKKHYIDISDIDLDTMSHINLVSKKIVYSLKEKLNVPGFKVLQNNGIEQEIKHYHVHIIPVYEDELELSIEEVYSVLKNS